MEQYSEKEIIMLVKAWQVPYQDWENDFPVVANAIILEIRKLEEILPKMLKIGIGRNDTQRAITKQTQFKNLFPSLYWFATHTRKSQIFKPPKKEKKNDNNKKS